VGVGAGVTNFQAIDLLTPLLHEPRLFLRNAGVGHFLALTPTWALTQDESGSGGVKWGAAQMTREGAVYYPEDLSLLGDVYDQAFNSLPPKMRTALNAAEIARNLLDHSARGERDPIELELAALMNLIVPVAA